MKTPQRRGCWRPQQPQHGGCMPRSKACRTAPTYSLPPGARRMLCPRSHPGGKGATMAGLHSRLGAACKVGLGTLLYPWATWVQSSASVSRVTFLSTNSIRCSPVMPPRSLGMEAPTPSQGSCQDSTVPASKTWLSSSKTQCPSRPFQRSSAPPLSRSLFFFFCSPFSLLISY